MESNIAAVVAALDLKLVRLLRDAMADDECHKGGLLGAAGPHVEPRKTIEPEPEIEPRKTFEPEPRFEPRKVHHPEPAFAPTSPSCPVESARPDDANNPIEPPWALLPWEQPAPAPPPAAEAAAARVKLARLRPDIAYVGRGRLIDVMS